MITHGRLFFSTVTGRPVRLTSAVTREKLFLASARPIVIAMAYSFMVYILDSIIARKLAISQGRLGASCTHALR